jgi:predicted dehydrogenase
MHASLMTSLIGAGVHVLVEKPFTEDAESTRAMVTLAAQRSVLVCPVHQFVYQDGIRKLGEWLPQLGTIRRFEFSTCSAGAVHDPQHADDLIAEILPHPLSLIVALLRTRVASVEWHVSHPAPGEFRALGSIVPTLVDVAISAHGRPTENVLRIVGDGGTVAADLFHGFAVRYPPTVSREAKMARPFAHSARHLVAAAANLTRRALRGEVAYPGLRELVRAFYAAADGSTAPPLSPDAICDVADARDSLISRLTPRRR